MDIRTPTLSEGKASCIAELNPLTDTPHSSCKTEISLIRCSEIAVCGRLGEPGHNPNRMRVACSGSQSQNVHTTTCTLAETKNIHILQND